MKLMAALLVLTAGAIAWRVDLVRRAGRVLYEFGAHDQLGYSLAFFTAPRIELAPSSFLRKRTPVPGECREGCLLFDVYSDPTAADVALEFDDGSIVRATIESERQVRLQLDHPKPGEVWLTWKPQFYDPGMGDGFVGCGQAMSAVGARPEHREGGRVGMRLKLEPTPGDLAFEFVGNRPYVP